MSTFKGTRRPNGGTSVEVFKTHTHNYACISEIKQTLICHHQTHKCRVHPCSRTTHRDTHVRITQTHTYKYSYGAQEESLHRHTNAHAHTHATQYMNQTQDMTMTCKVTMSRNVLAHTHTLVRFGLTSSERLACPVTRRVKLMHSTEPHNLKRKIRLSVSLKCSFTV